MWTHSPESKSSSISSRVLCKSWSILSLLSLFICESTLQSEIVNDGISKWTSYRFKNIPYPSRIHGPSAPAGIPPSLKKPGTSHSLTGGAQVFLAFSLLLPTFKAKCRLYSLVSPTSTILSLLQPVFIYTLPHLGMDLRQGF